MTTVDDKLKLFAKIVFERVEKDSEKKVSECTKNYDKLLEKEKENILKESDAYISQMKKKAEARKRQAISKANTDRQHELLKKRKELFDQMVSDIRKLAEEFTMNAEYSLYLEKCIGNGISGMDGGEVSIFFTARDIENHVNTINKAVNKYKKPGMDVTVDKTDRDIVGGCICEDSGRTRRVDCSMASVIEENREMIGRALMDNLQ